MALHHTIKPGECMATIAAMHRFLKWETIYDHANNAKFREDNPDPSCLEPGKTVFIPNKKQRPVEAKGSGKVTFVAKKQQLYLVVKLLDIEQKPLSDAEYELQIGSKITADKASGGLVEEKITDKDTLAVLTVTPYPEFPDWKLTYRIQIGQLANAITVQGQQARLQHHGILGGPVDGKVLAATGSAISRLQINKQMAADGKASAQTAALLKA